MLWAETRGIGFPEANGCRVGLGLTTARFRFCMGGGVMKLAMVIYSNEPEMVWNAFRLGVQALGQGDPVGIFLLGRGGKPRDWMTPTFRWWR